MPSASKPAGFAPSAACELRRRAEELVEQWKRILGLTDWRITVSTARRIRGAAADITYYWTLRKAHIRVSEDLIRAEREGFDDLEQVVVHELIHIWLAPLFERIQADEALLNVAEQGINAIADALVSLRRTGTGQALPSGS